MLYHHTQKGDEMWKKRIQSSQLENCNKGEHISITKSLKPNKSYLHINLLLRVMLVSFFITHTTGGFGVKQWVNMWKNTSCKYCEGSEIRSGLHSTQNLAAELKREPQTGPRTGPYWEFLQSGLVIVLPMLLWIVGDKV